VFPDAVFHEILTSAPAPDPKEKRSILPELTPALRIRGHLWYRPAMSNRNCLLSQKLCNYLNQGRKLNDILVRAAHGMTDFDLSKLDLI